MAKKTSKKAPSKKPATPDLNQVLSKLPMDKVKTVKLKVKFHGDK